MNESQISVRYAKALFQSASEQDLLDQVFKDMEELTSTCKLEDFQYMLEVPTLQPSQKIKLLASIFEKHFSKISLSMINLVVKNKRESFLPGIARNFKGLYRKEKGICTASLVTAMILGFVVYWCLQFSTGLWVLVRAAHDRRPYAKTMILAVLPIIIVTPIDTHNSYTLLDPPRLLIYALVFFLFVQTQVIGSKFANT